MLAFESISWLFKGGIRIKLRIFNLDSCQSILSTQTFPSLQNIFLSVHKVAVQICCVCLALRLFFFVLQKQGFNKILRINCL